MTQINVIISAPTNKVLTSVFVRRDINFTLTAQVAKVWLLKSYLIGKKKLALFIVGKNVSAKKFGSNKKPAEISVTGLK